MRTHNRSQHCEMALQVFEQFLGVAVSGERRETLRHQLETRLEIAQFECQKGT